MPVQPLEAGAKGGLLGVRQGLVTLCGRSGHPVPAEISNVSYRAGSRREKPTRIRRFGSLVAAYARIGYGASERQRATSGRFRTRVGARRSEHMRRRRADDLVASAPTAASSISPIADPSPMGGRDPLPGRISTIV